MADLSKPFLQALLVPDPRAIFENLDTVSSYTEAGPRPAPPVADQESALEWEASGDSDGTAYDLRVQVGGSPGRDGARFLWKPTTGGASQWRGWDPPVAMSGWEVIDSSVTASAYEQRHAITLASGVVLCAAQHLEETVRVWSLPVDGSAPSSVDVYTLAAGYTDGAMPCLVQLPSGRVLLFFLIEVGDDSQLRMYYSDDDGDTWTMGQRNALTHAIDRTIYDIRRLRVARLGGELMMVVWVTDATLPSQDVFIQYASQDLGASWAKIDTWTGDDYATSGAHHDLVAVDGAFVFGYLRDIDGTGADATPFIRRVGGAWDPLSAAEAIEAQDSSFGSVWSTLAAGVFSASGPLTLCADDDGTLYMLGRDVAAEDEGIILTSIDGGLTWSSIGTSQAPFGGAVWWQAGEPTLYPKDLAATCQGGRVLVFHGVQGSPSYDDSLYVLQLGGYTDVEWPIRNAGQKPTYRTTWGVSYMPWEFPENVGTTWTAATTGAPLVALTSGYLHIVQAGGEEAYWYGDITGDITYGIVVEVQLAVLSGVGGYAKVVVSDGTNGHSVSVKVSPTQMVVRDVDRGLDLVTVSLTAAEQSEVRFRIALRNSTGSGAANDGELKVWKRAGKLSTDRDWDLVVSSTTIYTGAHGNNRVSFGGILGVSAVNFGPVHVAADDTQLGLGMLDQDNPDDLQGRALAAVPTYVDGGLFLAGADGPGFREETWVMTPKHDYGVELVHTEVSRSPARRWRTTNNAAVATIVWALDDDTTLLESSYLAIFLDGINFRTAELQGALNGGAFSKICDIDAQHAGSLSFSRYGNSVTPNAASGNNGGWCPEHGLIDWTWVQSNTGSPVYRRVVRNSGGVWAPGSSEAPRVYLTGALNADDATGTNGQLWASRICVIVNDCTPYQKLKLYIPAQSTAEGYREVGIAMVGRVRPFGQLPSWNRELGFVGSAEVTTRRNGTRSVAAPAKVRRRVAFGWEDTQVRTTELWPTSPSPSYILSNVGGTGVATPASTLLDFGGLFQRLRGAKTPVVYLPRIFKVAAVGTDITLRAPDAMFYGTIVSTEFVMNQVAGNEINTERHRGGRVTLEEEL